VQERRKQPRKDLMSYSQVFEVNGGYLMGYLGDITPLGAMVICDMEMETNRSVTVRIELPELEGISDDSIIIPAYIRWCRQDISPEYFNVGIEFSELTNEQKKIVKALIENYEFRRQPPNYPTHPNELND